MSQSGDQIQKNQLKRSLNFKLISQKFFWAGIILLAVSASFLTSLPPSVGFSRPPELVVDPVLLLPEKIKIASAGIDLPVEPVTVKGNNWPLFDEAASYLAGSGRPGEKGNMIIYAHNRSGLFGNLKRVGEGDLIEIEDGSANRYLYQVADLFTINPDQVGILSFSEESILTLYTCTGWFDRQRLVIRARLKN
ncbi:MAG: sortase [Candidatus Pacebacteria bacterium]|nr:sortase [Candidatus Paceibacterota bacterium]